MRAPGCEPKRGGLLVLEGRTLVAPKAGRRRWPIAGPGPRWRHWDAGNKGQAGLGVSESSGSNRLAHMLGEVSTGEHKAGHGVLTMS